MNSPAGNNQRDSQTRAVFASTHWSVVQAAVDGSTSQVGAAMEKLCQTYWPPIYAFIRRQGHGPDDAQDLTQEFFFRLVEKEHLNHLVHREGKFRSFLLKFVQHFLADQRDKVRAQKRGGGRGPVSLDMMSPEERARFEPADELTPERAFEQQWARTLVRRAQERLCAEYLATGKAGLFDRLKDVQPGERGADGYARIAVELNMTEGAVKVAVHRMRLRHRELLRAEIAETVATPGDLEDEVRYLISVLGN